MEHSLFLNNNVEMPMVGLGVYKITDDSEAVTAISAATDLGYRLIDTASVYKNEEAIGKAIAKCSIPRKNLFITTKVWNNAQRLGDIEGAFARSLERLKTNYIDLYLVHWPVPGAYLETWKAMERIYESGRVRAIGVANFEIRHLEELQRVASVMPAVNQIENHPLRYQKDLINYCHDLGIQVQAYSPLARGAYLDNDIMCVIATKYAKTPAQIGLRWALQKGVAVIPKSSNPDRIRLNGDLFSFEISDEDMAIIDTLNEDYRAAAIPEDLRGIPF